MQQEAAVLHRIVVQAVQAVVELVEMGPIRLVLQEPQIQVQAAEAAELQAAMEEMVAREL
jgi:hypothetical protein